MKNYKLILLTTALLISGLANADKNRGSKTPPFNAVHKSAAGSCPNTTAQADLNINNVRARILNGGDMWWDPTSQTPYYEVPKGSNKNSLYSGAIWIGGYDATNALKVAAQTYRQTGANDFWGGPISKDPNTGITSITEARCNEFDKIWQITKEEVAKFVAGGEATPAIKEWPGNGDVTNGELQFLAPFIDIGGPGGGAPDGLYNWQDGDYPAYNLSGVYSDTAFGGTICNDYLFGDATFWWVFNDVGNNKTETNSAAIGLEIRAQGFEFKTNDEINNMTFYKYQIINRSSETLFQTYMGQWADPDLGNASDDYVGCDVGLGLGFVYNADPDDEGGYGVNPPALGIDFFQGPLADANDGLDNDNDGTTDEPGEQIIMSKFMYYLNLNLVPNGNPNITADYYSYLDGKWLDGKLVTFGGDGRTNQPPTAPACNYMFPGTSDPAFPGQEWTMGSAGIPGDDMRFLQSAGTFTLAPGATNYVTTGVVWARTGSAGPLGSLNLVKLADQKAQSLFDNCFKVLDGPDAPDMVIRELDQQLVLSLENTNNKGVELYNEIDPTIPPSVLDSAGNIVALTTDEKSFKFQGYMVYQVKNKNVSADESELRDASKARLIKQIDIQDGITTIVNFELDANTGFYVPVEKTDVISKINKGIVHTLTINQDAFTGQSLVNYQPYYFMVKSFAYNNYRQFNPYDPNLTQAKPYFPGRLNINVYSGIPHKPFLNSGGTVLNSSAGTLPIEITRVEGKGNGGNVLDIKDVSELFTAPYRVTNPVYTAGHGPIRIGIYDPFKVSGGDLGIRFRGLTDDSRWDLIEKSSGTIIDSSGLGIGTLTQDIITSKGLTVDVTKVYEASSPLAINNAFLEATKTYTDNTKQWLSGVVDGEGADVQDWIRTGVEPTDKKGDDNQVYEGLIGGTWAPFLITDDTYQNGSPKWPNIQTSPDPTNPLSNNIKWATLNSVDVVITPDKSKWTRSIVIQLSKDTTSTVPAIKLKKFDKRRQISVDKDGLESGGSTTDPNSSNYIDSVGMSWFPGYAVNVETGERLNIGFGEDSLASNDNGFDMLWNPTARVYGDVASGDSGKVIYGGKHYIYIFNRNDADTMPPYDGCERIDSLLRKNFAGGRQKVYKSCIWTSLPVLTNSSFSFSDNGNGKKNIPPGEVKIRLRVAKAYGNFVSSGATAVNSGNPYYQFSVPGSIAPTFNVESVAKSAMDNIQVVPNPYYAYDAYERTREDQLDSRIRFTNLPSHCTVSIYTNNGTLIRQIRRDVSNDISAGQAVDNGQDFNLSSTLDWDLKNTAGIPIASGIYIIHIDAGSLGEKVIKWFGVMRPLDLDTF